MKQLDGNIKHSHSPADNYDDKGGEHDDDEGQDDDDDDAAVVPLSTFWAWPEREREGG